MNSFIFIEKYETGTIIISILQMVKLKVEGDVLPGSPSQQVAGLGFKLKQLTSESVPLYSKYGKDIYNPAILYV